jgi:hypothetical protein
MKAAGLPVETKAAAMDNNHSIGPGALLLDDCKSAPRGAGCPGWCEASRSPAVMVGRSWRAVPAGPASGGKRPSTIEQRFAAKAACGGEAEET